MIVVVLGMHKSGTTLVARMLAESGFHMGDFDERLDYDAGNKCERMETQAANRALLEGLSSAPFLHRLRQRRGSRLDAAGHPRNLDSQAWVRTGALAARLAQPETAQRLARVVEAIDVEHRDWGFKDPRSALTYPAWRRVLPEHRVVVVYRGLAQVLRRSRAGWRHPFRTLRVVYSWTLHNHSILRHFEGNSAPVIFVRFESLMQDDLSYQRLSRFLGRPLYDAREPARYRSRTPAPFPGWTRWLRPFLPADPGRIERALHRRALESAPTPSRIASRTRRPQEASS